jgi:hypothetical protein
MYIGHVRHNIDFIFYHEVKVKLSPYQAVEAYSVVRC